MDKREELNWKRKYDPGNVKVCVQGFSFQCTVERASLGTIAMGEVKGQTSSKSLITANIETSIIYT